MNDPVPSVKGWCPGALQPMRSGDGLVVRLRLSGGVVPSDLARSVAVAASTFGNGSIDLSQRANLQIRGVTDDRWPGLIAGLRDLGVLDDDASVEAVRNIIASPLAGLDPSAEVDGRAVAQALEARIVADPLFRRLPGKFGFLVDEGGALPLDTVATDIRFLGIAGGLAVELGGDPGEIVRLGVVDPGAVGDAAARLVAAFLDLRGSGPDAPRRMRGVVARHGIGAVAQAAGFDPDSVVRRRLRAEVESIGICAVGARSPDVASGAAHAHPILAVGIPFGRLSSEALTLLAAAGDLRLTPWRTILVIPTDPAVAPATHLARFAAAGLIVDARDPRRAVTACPGAPECESAAGAVRPDALALSAVASRLAGAGVRLHVSGCIKGCARPERTSVTLVARSGGYDLILDGRAGDAPVSTGLQRQDIESVLRNCGRL